MQQNTTDIVDLKKYLRNLDPEQKTLYENLSGLPPKELLKDKVLTPIQQCKWADDVSSWEIIAFRLAYFLAKRIGRWMPDPLDCQGLNSFKKKYFDTVSRLFLAELDLVIEGWKLIESSALKERAYFPFSHPYQLFADVCRFRAKNDASDLLSDKAINQSYLSTYRQGLREESSFFRDRLEIKTKKQKLASCKDSEDWVYFAIFAIWNYRDSNDDKYKDLVKSWGDFLKAHKNYVAMFFNKDFFGEKDVSIIAYTYTGDGRIMSYHNRKMLEGKLVNNSLMFHLVQ